MMRFIFAVFTIAVFACAPAHAAGINLSWDDCGSAGFMEKTWACNVNIGAPFSMLGSYIPPDGITEFLGLSAQVDVCTMTPTFIDWWAHGTGRCRSTTGFSVNFDFTSQPTSCTDVFFGQAAGGYAYDVSFGDIDRARIRIQCAVPFDNRVALDATTEYDAFRINLGRSKSAGTGSCAGCTAHACIILNSIQLFQPPALANDPELYGPIDRNFVLWQGSLPGCPFIVPVRATSWGRVKNLYR